MEVLININDYLSESDKIEIAKDAFKEAIRKGVIEELKADSSKRMANYERVISNSIHYYLESEIDAILGTDTRKMIEDNVMKTIGSHKYDYSLFRSKNAWDSEDSPAQSVVKQTIQEIAPQMKEALTKKMMENIEALDTDQTLDIVREIFYTIIEDKLKK